MLPPDVQPQVYAGIGAPRRWAGGLDGNSHGPSSSARYARKSAAADTPNRTVRTFPCFVPSLTSRRHTCRTIVTASQVGEKSSRRSAAI